MPTESALKKSKPEEVVKIVNTLGLKRSAEHYDIDPSTLWRWLKKHNFKSKRQYVKESPLQPA